MDTVIILQRAPNNEDELWEKALNQYMNPSSDVNEAVDFIDEMSVSMYKLADDKFKL